MKTFTANLIATLSVIGLLTGPILYVFRVDVASPLEKLINVTATFLFGLIVIGTIYVIGKKGWLREPDPQVRQERLDGLKKKFRKLLNVYVPIWLVIIVIHMWLLLMGKN